MKLTKPTHIAFLVSAVLAMLTAIFFMVLISMMMLLVSNTTAMLFQQTTSNYQKEQASLLAYSYKNLALLAIKKHAFHNNTCLQSLTFKPKNSQNYHITLQLQYIGIDKNITCPTALYQSTNTFTTSQSSVIIDTFVSYVPSMRLNTLAIEKKSINTTTLKNTFHHRSLEPLRD